MLSDMMEENFTEISNRLLTRDTVSGKCDTERATPTYTFVKILNFMSKERTLLASRRKCRF